MRSEYNFSCNTSCSLPFAADLWPAAALSMRASGAALIVRSISDSIVL